jgi:8-hydroxy-5-deazaflavin:NADPH oxidoreductase
VDAGSVDESWRQQPGTPVYATDFDADGVGKGLAEAKPERKAEFRAGAGSPAAAGRR